MAYSVHNVVVTQDYSTEGMSDGLLVFLQHLREFGLVYQRKVRYGNNCYIYISLLNNKLMY
jgi:transcription initiation factor TFIIH subunit 4